MALSQAFVLPSMTVSMVANDSSSTPVDTFRHHSVASALHHIIRANPCQLEIHHPFILPNSASQHKPSHLVCRLSDTQHCHAFLLSPLHIAPFLAAYPLIIGEEHKWYSLYTHDYLACLRMDTEAGDGHHSSSSFSSTLLKSFRSSNP